LQKNFKKSNKNSKKGLIKGKKCDIIMDVIIFIKFFIIEKENKKQ